MGRCGAAGPRLSPGVVELDEVRWRGSSSRRPPEAGLMRLVGGSVPVPEVILAEPGPGRSSALMLQCYVETPTLPRSGRKRPVRGCRGGGTLGGRNTGRHGSHHVCEAGVARSRTHGHQPLSCRAPTRWRASSTSVLRPGCRAGSWRNYPTERRRRSGRTPPRSAGRPTRRPPFTATSADATSSSGSGPVAGSWRRLSTGRSRSPVLRSPTSDTPAVRGKTAGDRPHSEPAIWRGLVLVPRMGESRGPRTTREASLWHPASCAATPRMVHWLSWI